MQGPGDNRPGQPLPLQLILRRSRFQPQPGPVSGSSVPRLLMSRQSRCGWFPPKSGPWIGGLDGREMQSRGASVELEVTVWS